MPGLFSSIKEDSFFRNPKKVALAAWATGTFSLLIPTCLKLAPLGNSKHDSKDELNEATSDYNQAFKELDTANASLIEARQRVIDLDCAMDYYKDFNNRMRHFQLLANDSLDLPPTDRLRLIWDVNFVPDTYTYEEFVERKSWSESELKYERFYGRHGESKCGKGKS